VGSSLSQKKAFDYCWQVNKGHLIGSSIVRAFMFNVHFQVPLPQEYLRSFGLLAALSTSHKKEGGQQNEERRGENEERKATKDPAPHNHHHR